MFSADSFEMKWNLKFNILKKGSAVKHFLDKNI